MTTVETFSDTVSPKCVGFVNCAVDGQIAVTINAQSASRVSCAMRRNQTCRVDGIQPHFPHRLLKAIPPVGSRPPPPSGPTGNFAHTPDDSAQKKAPQRAGLFLFSRSVMTSTKQLSVAPKPAYPVQNQTARPQQEPELQC
jgi:hypothetical protein